MLQTEIDQGLRRNIYLGAAVSTSLLALTGLATQHYGSAIIAFVFSAFVTVFICFQNNPAYAKYLSVCSLLLIVFLAIVTLFSPFVAGGLAEHWSYIFPVIVFFILPAKSALITVTAYTIALTFLTATYYSGPSKPQLLINYFFCLLLSCAFVYLREEREKQLKPLRKTNNLTLASVREHLAADLAREIQRSEREGSGLSVLALAIDHSTITLREDMDIAHLLRLVGRILHENLRLFDTYYRYRGEQFLIVLPHTNTPDAIKKAESLRLKCKKKLNPDRENITVSIGVAGLNVGDDSKSMQTRALRALKQAQSKGTNRTQSYLNARTIEAPLAEDQAQIP
ncbi:MAG: diguanylate cyclase [Gammaproteobacteria bacterium]|nr:MAG: diguanylate cyclase [Gammaproteobacteria bacterium]